MATLAGNYQFESQDNYVEYLMSLGMEQADAKKSESNDSKLVIGPIEADKITVAFNENPIVFTLNKEVEYSVSGGHKKKVTVTLNGEVLTMKTKIADDGSLIEDKVFTPTATGLAIHTSNTKGIAGERRYKRI